MVKEKAEHQPVSLDVCCSDIASRLSEIPNLDPLCTTRTVNLACKENFDFKAYREHGHVCFPHYFPSNKIKEMNTAVDRVIDGEGSARF